MHRSNLKLILAVSLLFGMSTGVYEFILPYFLRAQGISLQSIGAIFALSGIAVLFARIYMGGLSDRLGRKTLYGWALAICGAATVITPQLPHLIAQVLLKTLRETAALTRETIHPIVLYEARREGFLNLIGKFRGVEYFLQAGGTLLAGIVLALAGENVMQAYRVALYLGGGILLLGALGWVIRFREAWTPPVQTPTKLRQLLNFNMHPNLLLIAISGIIFSFGLQLSHSFYMVLFFQERFGAAVATPHVTMIIMVLHRLTLALPLLIVGQLPLKNYKAWFIFGLIIQGITVACSPFLPGVWLSAGVFLLHDFIGSGIWSPIQSTLIQHYSRDETRGLEVGKVLAWGNLGAVLGPLTAGWLAGHSSVLPFFFSGIFMGAAALPLFWLNLRLPHPAAEQAVAAA